MKSFVLLGWLWLVAGVAVAQPTTVPVGNTTVTVTSLATKLDTPWELLWGPDNFLWMTERPGRISHINPATGQVLPLLTVPDVAEEGEGGLLGMALHPDFATSPYVYVVYTYTAGSQLREKLVRYTYSGGSLGSPVILLSDIPAARIHSGSRLLFLPDGTLLMSTGDAANQSNPQDAASLNGKILRLAADGSIPASNPQPSKYLYTLGHRNPQGLALGPNGRIYSSEHGPDSNDEINLIEAGRNYGWPTVKGFCDEPAEKAFCTEKNVKEPLFAWTPTLAVSGLAYYNHPAIPEWRNSLLLNSLKAGQLLQLPLQTDGTSLKSAPVLILNRQFGRLRAICVAPDGRVFLGTSNRDGSGAGNANDDQILMLQNKAYAPTATVAATAPLVVTVWPNPATNQIKLQLSAPLPVVAGVTVHDALGRQVGQATLAAGQAHAVLPLRNLRAGWYTLRIQGPQQESVVRFTIK
ncbi:PQQ-dependent sugar dehydrogenase [Hymenobacter sp. DG25A]|uniref:PQQ-dependent sugar dehydrogenase n=1 Tax=Hymenobacter sp. DG25A TaxID=1385663 RepID=UPI000AD0CBE7|nr:PQQ-dependent sugar dehydrogenase [Hymenobacter sp. DG25A]